MDNVRLMSHLLCPMTHAIALVFVNRLDEVDIEPLEGGVRGVSLDWAKVSPASQERVRQRR